MKTFVYVILILLVGVVIGNTTFKNSLFSFLENKDSKIEKLNKQAEDTWLEITDLAKKETGVVFDMQYLDAMITMYEGSSKLSTLGGNIGTSKIKELAKEISTEDIKRLEELKKLRSELEKQINNDSDSKQKPPFIK